ncbi:DUF928 domain-containing protein [Phormidesmis priestleyi]
MSAVLALYLGSPLKAVGQSIEPPPGQGSPNGTVGGGSRTSSSFCLRSPQPTQRLMALTPPVKSSRFDAGINRPDDWMAALMCNQNDRTSDWVGWIKRIELESAKAKLASAEVGDSVSLYVAQGLRNKAFSLLTQRRQTKLQNSYFSLGWAKLPKSIDLGTRLTDAIASQNR